MLKSELYRQIMHPQDWLSHVCLESEKPWAVPSRLRELRCFTSALTQVYWNQLRLSKCKPRKAKAVALHLIDELILDVLKKGACKCRQDALGVFTARTRKPGIPLSAIVTEQASWQKLVCGFFLQRALRGLVPKDPFAVQSLLVIVENLSSGFPSANAAFSVDIEDTFYSISQNELLKAVRELIESSGTVPFQNECGIPLGPFLELLGAYLRSTIVLYGDKTRGRCCIWPIASHFQGAGVRHVGLDRREAEKPAWFPQETQHLSWAPLVPRRVRSRVGSRPQTRTVAGHPAACPSLGPPENELPLGTSAGCHALPILRASRFMSRGP
ncbi:hypothetical protein HPB50_004024 [Hyalomma asiaticum]|uniref:Uncharacterized protein n=1 Tax=Hyalomma asiaticum TaxID=266040 RepID=A0ACB7SSR7_HYAAI|nr:hypothetical protein HPB50_004024 [Hyalomma asiaticum]